MKYFRSSYLIHFSDIMLGCLMIVLLSNCTKKFDEINTDPTKLTSLSANDVKALFPTAEYSGMYGAWGYQTAQGLFADQYAQYFAGTQTAFASHRYVIVQKWVKDQFVTAYVNVMGPIQTIIQNTNEGKAPVLNGIARIWKTFVMHRTTDYYGPIPYSKIGSDSIVIAYDAQKDIYYDFFKELAEATSDLKNNIDLPNYGEGDLIYTGADATNNWIKFGNTLRLRLALRISKVEPDKAKAEAEAAVADGVFTDVSDDAICRVTDANFNAFCIQSGWNEFRMSANMESLLVGYSDPRLSKYFQPAKNGGYHGARNGMEPAEQQLAANSYDNFSNVSVALTPEDQGNTPMKVLRSAEAYFLRAEGALNGWNMGGTAEELYKKGIEMAMKAWGVTDMNAINAYINGTSLPSAPGGYFNTPALTDIPVKFSSDPVKQREQILTQKWLALYPDGHEAWAEMRRSTYPKMYPIIHSDNPDVPANTMIRRITFLDYDRNTNAPAVDAAVDLLGGPDKASTPLWWDKN